MILEFVVAGRPKPKQRPRVTRNGTFTPKETKNYEKEVGLCAMVAYANAKGFWPVDAVYAVECDFYVPDFRRFDGDNALKSVQDGLEDVLYKDDNQVIEGHYRVHRGSDKCEARIRVWVRDESQG